MRPVKPVKRPGADGETGKVRPAIFYIERNPKKTVQSIATFPPLSPGSL